MAQHRVGHALPRAFALSSTIHEHELDTIWRASWLFAGASVLARLPGDFFRVDLAAGDSVIIVRDEDGELRALHNTCRHREMPVCPQPSGHARRWVCPYHQWSYGLDGRLLGCGGEEAGMDIGCTARRWPRSQGLCSCGSVPTQRRSTLPPPTSPRRWRRRVCSGRRWHT